MPTYTLGIPTALQSLGITQQNIQNNFQALNDTIDIDHVAMVPNPNSPGNIGKHRQVHLPAKAAAPTTISGEGALYTKTAAAGNQLYYIRDNVGATEVALTSASANYTGPSRTQNGWSWLPGNILIQWGFAGVSNGIHNIPFNVNFANVGGFAPIVTLTGFTSTSPTNNIFIAATAFNQFTYTNFSNSITNIYWHAIGPT